LVVGSGFWVQGSGFWVLGSRFRVQTSFLNFRGVLVAVTRIDKPWGYELHWAKTDRYVGKLIHVNAGHALSLQYHNEKDETIFLWSGRMLFEIQHGETLVKREMKVGESVHITPKTVHRMTAIEDCDIFEVSTPELHDVVRLEDRYGRTT
jgi:mannose-6-phosphate isomerase-like protein (cupin superfamily)